MKEQKLTCPLLDGCGECTARKIPCVEGDEICEIAVSAFYKGKHYEEVCRENAAKVARSMETLHALGQINRMRKRREQTK